VNDNQKPDDIDQQRTDGDDEVRELIRLAKAGDTDARDRLFEACRSYLGMIARAQVETWIQAKVDASDLVQQTMLEAYRDFQRFSGDSEGEWLGWLRKILRHNAADFVRHFKLTEKRAANREVRFADPGDSLAVGAPEPSADVGTPSQEMMRLDDRVRVSQAIDKLPEDYREVIQLRNVHKLSFNEIAEQMDRTRPAVQMLWMRALKKLQSVLENEDE